MARAQRERDAYRNREGLGALLGAGLSAPFGRSWVSLGILGRLRKKMWLKYHACAQDLASENLPSGPAGLAGATGEAVPMEMVS